MPKNSLTSWKRCLRYFGILLVCAIFVLVVFSGYFISSAAPDWLRKVAVEVQTACRDPGTQWMVVVCLVSYFVAFIFLERKLSPSNVAQANLWLIGFLTIVILRYALDYETAAGSMLPLVLVAGIVFGKGVALWAAWPLSLKAKVKSLKLEEADSRHLTINRTRW